MIFDFLAHWNDLLLPLIYLNRQELFTLPQGLASFRALYATQWNLLMAGSLLALLPILALTLAAQRLLARGHRGRPPGLTSQPVPRTAAHAGWRRHPG